MTLDWLFAPTDNINLIIEVAVGLVATAYVAGWWSRRKIEAWLSSDRSNPYVDRIVSRVADKIEFPDVPTVGTIVEAVKAELPTDDRLNLLEERVGAKLQASMDAKWTGLQDQLSTRVGQVVQANLASAKAAFKRGIDDDGGTVYDLGILGEVFGALGVDNETLERFGKAKNVYDRAKAAGGGKLDLKALIKGGSPGGGNGSGATQQVYDFGTIKDWGNGQGPMIATRQGWVAVSQLAPAPFPQAAPTTPPKPDEPAPMPEDLPPPLPPEVPEGAR